MNPNAAAPQMAGMPTMGTPGQGGATVDPSQFGNYSEWAKGEMAKGFTPEQLHQTLQESGADVKPAHSGNWFTHLLPTIGSVAAPVLGTLLAPETGGLSLIAAAGLSGLGAAGGKAAENAAEGKGVGDDLVTAGLEGTIGGGAGGVAGKFLGKASGALASRAEKVATDKAATAAAEDGIEGVANAYKDISPQLQKAYNAKDSIAHVGNMGFDPTDPANLIHVSNTSGDILNSALDSALASSGPVDLSHFPQLVKDALAKEGGTLGSYEKVALSRGRLGNANTPAAKLLQQLEDLGAGVAKSNSDPNELRTLTTKLGQLAQDAKPSVTAATGAIDPQQRAVYNVLNDVRNQVKTALYDRPEVNEALAGQVGNITAKDVGSQELADHLNNVLTKAGQGDGTAAQDLLTELSRNINIGNLGEEGQRVGQIVTSTGAKARAATEAGLDNPGMDTHPLLEAANTVSPHKGVVGNAASFVAHSAKNPAILQTLSRIGAMGEKLAPAAGSVVATSPNLGADPLPVAGMGVGGTMGGTMDGTQPLQANGAHSYQDLINAMEAQAVLAPSMGGGASSFLAQVAPQLQHNQLTGAALSGLPGSFANAGGAQGMGGILSRISALIPGTAAHTYQGQQEAAAAQLAKSMGISPEAAMSLLPQLMQNGQTAGVTNGILSNISGQLAY
jgi:hypothetical protein